MQPALHHDHHNERDEGSGDARQRENLNDRHEGPVHVHSWDHGDDHVHGRNIYGLGCTKMD